MTITKKPARPAHHSKKAVEAETFIQAAEHAEPVEAGTVDVAVEEPIEIEVTIEAEAVELAPKAKKKAKEKEKDKEKDKDKDKRKKKDKKNKEAVIIRFEDGQLTQIDARAETLGLARAAWVRMVVAQALAKE
jgi:predicted DNA binding CopG/RHH family protein